MLPEHQQRTEISDNLIWQRAELKKAAIAARKMLGIEEQHARQLVSRARSIEADIMSDMRDAESLSYECLR